MEPLAGHRKAAKGKEGMAIKPSTPAAGLPEPLPPTRLAFRLGLWEEAEGPAIVT